MASTALSEPSGAAAFTVRLRSITYAARDALLFELSAVGGALPSVRAGAHLDIHLPAGQQRQYSLVTPLCSAKSYVVAVKREQSGRGGSRWLHDEARVGMDLQVGRPRNNFGLDESAETTLLLAGGIGITPIYAMFVRLQELGRSVRLHYWSRSAEHALFLDHLHGHPDVTLHYASLPGRASAGEVLTTSGPRTAVYCCGPTRMLDECTANAPYESRLHVERFATPLPPLAVPLQVSPSISPGGVVTSTLRPERLSWCADRCWDRRSLFL